MKDCFKITNNKGIILSLGGDDNCRRDNKRDRLSVIFHTNSPEMFVEVIPGWLTPQETAELLDHHELTVWNDPDRFSSLLQRHLNE